jgi:RNA polymerase sigma-70 factor (ECF subfamily)
LTRGPRDDLLDSEGDGMDATLTASLAGPDRAHGRAFGDLVGEQLDGAYRLAAVILGDAIEAEDAVSDAAVAAWAGFGGHRDVARVEAWCARILINGCRDRLRRRKRVHLVDLGATLDVLREHDRRADLSTEAADRDAIARAMSRLDPDHQVALVLRYWLDLPVDAIAVRLAIPAGTAKSRIHHAKRRLRQVLDDEARR